MTPLLHLLTGTIVLLSLNHPDGVYAAGDTVRIYASAGPDTLLVHEEVCAAGPSTAHFGYGDTSIGWVVDPDLYVQSLPCPDGFDTWWQAQVDAMRALPMNPVLTEVPSLGRWDGSRFICMDVRLDCTDGTPVRGYLALPRDAAPGTLPIVVFAHAAGVAGNWCRCHPEEAVRMAGRGSGAICVDINAFGMENDRPRAYYDSLANGPLKDYSRRASEGRDDYIFKGMYLRMVRALDFACTLTCWDGRRVVACGQSQGGCQAIALGGLDRRVSHIIGIVPAGCNPYGSIAVGGADGWPFTYRSFGAVRGAEILPWFDCCNFLARTRAEIWFEIGLMDDTCPPQAIYSALNANRESRRRVLTSPWRSHSEPDARYHDRWERDICDARMEYLDSLLR